MSIRRAKFQEGKHSAECLTEAVLTSFALKAFVPSRYFTVLFDLHAHRVVHCSGDALQVIGFSREEFSHHLWERMIAPEFIVSWKRNMKLIRLFFDKLGCEEIPNYLARFSYRIYDRQGTVRCLQQTHLPIVAKAEDGVDQMVIVVRQAGTEQASPMGALDLIGLNGCPTYFNFSSDGIFLDNDIGLTKREGEVFQLLKRNFTTAEIAGRLYLSKHTVRIHRRNLLKKLGAYNARELLYKSGNLHGILS